MVSVCGLPVFYFLYFIFYCYVTQNERPQKARCLYGSPSGGVFFHMFNAVKGYSGAHNIS